MESNGLLVIGAGGHCKVMLECLSLGDYSKVGIIDSHCTLNSTFQGYPVIGDDSAVPAARALGYKFFFVAIQGNMVLRKELIERCVSLGYEPIQAIHQSAVISPTATIHDGAMIGPQCVINADAVIGRYATINSGAVIEHDTIIEEFSHIAPHSTLLGGVFVGKNTLIGAGSVVLPQLRIESKSVIGAGSVVTHNIPSNSVAYGTPATIKS